MVIAWEPVSNVTTELINIEPRHAIKYLTFASADKLTQCEVGAISTPKLKLAHKHFIKGEVRIVTVHGVKLGADKVIVEHVGSNTNNVRP